MIPKKALVVLKNKSLRVSKKTKLVAKTSKLRTRSLSLMLIRRTQKVISLDKKALSPRTTPKALTLTPTLVQILSLWKNRRASSRRRILMTLS